MSNIESGHLVKAFGKPIWPINLNVEIDYECLGVVESILDGIVSVSWPGIGKLKFRYSDLETIDSNRPDLTH